MAVSWRRSAVRWFLTGAFLVLGVFPIRTGAAQTQQQIDWCRNRGLLFSYGLQISGCTGVIQSGRSNLYMLWAFHSRGYAYYRTDKFDDAIADFSQVIRLDPLDASALNGRCWLRAIVGRDLQGALEDCDESLRLRANDAQTLDSRGFTCLKLGQFNHAIADYNAALALQPNQAESLFGRGAAKLKKGDTQAGSADIAEAKARDPGITQEFAKYGVKLDGTVVTIAPADSSGGRDCARVVAQWTGPGRR